VRKRIRVGMVAGALLTLAFAPTTAGASEISGDDVQYVRFDCGINCGGVFRVNDPVYPRDQGCPSDRSGPCTNPFTARSVVQSGLSGHVDILYTRGIDEYGNQLGLLLCEIHAQPDERARVSANGNIRFSKAGVVNSVAKGTVTWSANQDDGEHDQWTYSTSAESCNGLSLPAGAYTEKDCPNPDFDRTRKCVAGE
jgi:hypothetical protein